MAGYANQHVSVMPHPRGCWINYRLVGIHRHIGCSQTLRQSATVPSVSPFDWVDLPLDKGSFYTDNNWLLHYGFILGQLERWQETGLGGGVQQRATGRSWNPATWQRGHRTYTWDTCSIDWATVALWICGKSPQSGAFHCLSVSLCDWVRRDSPNSNQSV